MAGPLYYMTDDASPTVAGGWGSCDQEEPWVAIAGTGGNFSKAGGELVAVWASGGQMHKGMDTFLARGIDIYSKIRLDKIPVTNTISACFDFRKIDSNNYLRARIVRITTAGQVRYQVQKIVGGSASNVIADAAHPSLSAHPAGNRTYKVRIRCTDSGGTGTVWIKVWLDGDSEPGSWDTSGTFTDAVLLAPGSLDLRFEANTATNPNLTCAWSDLEAKAVSVASTVTISDTPLVTNEIKPSAYAVQRFLRSGMSSGEKAAAVALMSSFVDSIAYHWSGGYRNQDPSYQLWSARDFAPAMGSGRVWDDSGSRQGLDTAFSNLDALRVTRSNARMVLVMHDHPVAMLDGGTRSGQTQMPWPTQNFWGASYAGQLASDIISRYTSDRILAFSYGQELKGFADRTDTDSLREYAAGYTKFAQYMRANHPGVELWYPHVNFFATSSQINTTRKTAMDALIAGGNDLGPNDNGIINTLLQEVDASLVDRVTFDVSILDNSSMDSWRGNYYAVSRRTMLEYHLARVLKARMTTYWGSQKPLVAIESYFDVNQTLQDWVSEEQSAALQAAIIMAAMRAGVTYHYRWEPQGGTPGSEAPDGNIASWWTEDGVKFKAYDYTKDLRLAIPPNTPLKTVSSNNPDVEVVASQTKAFVLNKGQVPAAVSISWTGGSDSFTLDPYEYQVIDTGTQVDISFASHLMGFSGV